MQKWIGGLEVGTSMVEINTSDGRRGAGEFTVATLARQAGNALDVWSNELRR